MVGCLDEIGIVGWFGQQNWAKCARICVGRSSEHAKSLNFLSLDMKDLASF